MAKRKNLTKKTRFEVFKRDHFTCQYCGRTPPAVVLKVDHIVPVADGGDNEQINLLTSCFDCNSGKGARPLGIVPAPLAAQIALEAERREQVKLFNEFLTAAREDATAAVRRLGYHWHNKLCPAEDRNRWVFSDDTAASVRLFLKSLPEAILLDFMDIAQSRVPATFRDSSQAFRYFCGMCWRRIKEAEGRS